jgi:predicted ester cyclase
MANITADNVVKRQTEAWNEHDGARVAKGYSADAIVLDPAYPEPLTGREAIAKDASDFFIAFPDIIFRAGKILVDGETAVVEAIAKGTHAGPLLLPAGLIPATSRPVEFNLAIISDLDEAGSISRERRYYDLAALLSQLGLWQ